MKVGAIYLGPIFESAEHGYDTTDYKVVDRRLGDNASFKKICDELHKADIKIILDGVFNHVGRECPFFKDVQQNKNNSQYCSWISGYNPNGKSPYGDDFSYDSWNGCYNLVKLNLKNPVVTDYLLEVVKFWMDEFDIDGIRFDAADCIDRDFFKRVHQLTKDKKPDFWLMGEIIHGDYNVWANSEMLDSTTNYECYKGIWSSHNENNYWEINYSYNRQSAGEGGGGTGIYKNLSLYNFVDNHDVNRLASVLKLPEYLFNCYTLLYTMPGVPSIYYGSEYGIKGIKENNSDDGLRPELNISTISADGAAGTNARLYRHIVKLGEIRMKCPALARCANYQTLEIKNKQMLFKRAGADSSSDVFVALNIDSNDYTFTFDFNGELTDVLSNYAVRRVGGRMQVTIPACSAAVMTSSMAEEGAIAMPVTPAAPIIEAAPAAAEQIEVITIAKDVTTKREMVVYRDAHGEVWVKYKE
jgi:glycosidase